jgi:hypothetical protein
MTIGNFCGSYFLALQDVCGRRAVNFGGNAIVIVAGLMQGLSTNLGVFMAGLLHKLNSIEDFRVSPEQKSTHLVD